MTDIVVLARRLYKQIKWQSIPDEMTREDMAEYIADAIRHLYVMTGRGLSFKEEWLVTEDERYTHFTQTLPADEQEYVVVTAMLDFYRAAQASVDHLVSYTTDAFSLTHGDKPFQNINTMIQDAERLQRSIWYKMTRFHHL